MADKWMMPEWMEPYRKYFVNTGGNSVEELMNDHSTTAENNIILAGLIVCMHSQVNLLSNLKRAGLLKQKEEGFDDKIKRVKTNKEVAELPTCFGTYDAEDGGCLQCLDAKGCEKKTEGKGEGE